MSHFKRFNRAADDLVKELKVDGTSDSRRGLEYQIGEGVEHAVNTALGLGAASTSFWRNGMWQN